MELKAKTFWEMEKESITFIHANEKVWVQKAVLAAVVSDLEKNEFNLSNAFKAQDANNPGGQVAQKREQLIAFYHKIYRLERKLSFLAKDIGDEILLNNTNFAETTFQKTSEKMALIRFSGIITRWYEYLNKAAGYEISAEDLQSLTGELAMLENMQAQIGLITNDRKSAVRLIRELIGEARRLLDKLDDGFEGMIDHENYLSAWFAIRKIKGRAIVNISDHQ